MYEDLINNKSLCRTNFIECQFSLANRFANIVRKLENLVGPINSPGGNGAKGCYRDHSGHRSKSFTTSGERSVVFKRC